MTTVNNPLPAQPASLPWPRRLLRLSVVLVVTVGTLASLAVVIPATLADLATMQARWQIGRWMSGAAKPPLPEQWAQARQALATGMAYTPTDANLHELLGWLYASRGMAVYSTLPTLAQDYLLQAQEQYLVAVRWRPMSAVSWANLALATHYLQTPQPDILWPAFDKALAWGAREGVAQRSVAEIGLARWAELTPDRQQALQTMLLQAQPRNRQPLQEIARRHGRARMADPPPVP